MYAVRQAAWIRGSLLIDTLIKWTSNSPVPKRAYFTWACSRTLYFRIVVPIFVDDMAFDSNSIEMLTAFKESIASNFDVNIFGELKTFIGWQTRHGPSGISTCQQRYVREPLKRNQMTSFNSSYTSMANDASIRPAQEARRCLIWALTYFTGVRSGSYCFFRYERAQTSTFPSALLHEAYTHIQ